MAKNFPTIDCIHDLVQDVGVLPEPLKQELTEWMLQNGLLTLSIIKLAQENNLKKQMEQQKEGKRRQKEELMRQAEVQKFENAFPRLWRTRVNDPIAYRKCLERATLKEVTDLYNIIQSKPRHYSSIFNYEVNNVLKTLNLLISMKKSEKPSLVTKIKNALNDYTI
jgi:hypothetical protein